jgi:hypothetical protein
MLDLDSLAEKRAQTVNEQKDHWHKSVWSAGFQKISASMSDGEVEALLTSCKSFMQLDAVVAYVSVHTSLGRSTPFSILAQESKAAGLELDEWIATLPKVKA